MLIYNSMFPQIRNGLFHHLQGMLPELAGAGFGGLLLPPITQTAWGSNSQSMGYDKRYDLNVGQFPGDALRWGSASDLRNLTREAAHHGLFVMEDNVIHQYGGAANQTYFERGASGALDRKLIPKYPSCFVNVTHAVDHVFNPEGNAAFGDQVTFEHCRPQGYMLNVVIQATRWRWHRLGLGGMRVDDSKGEAASVSKALCSAGTLRDGWNFCEVFVGTVAELEDFIEQTGQRVLDFPFHWAVQRICDNGAPLSSMVGSSLWETDPSHAVTFVDTFDTDQDANENIKWNKLWAYCLLAMVPCAGGLVYGGDYEHYGLGEPIRNLAWIAATFAFGKHRWEFADSSLLVWSRDGDGGDLGWSGGLLCGFSSDAGNTRRQWVHTPFAPGTLLHDYTGHGPDLIVNGDGWVECVFGPNVNGSAANYCCWAPAGVNRALPSKALQWRASGLFTDFSEITVRYA